MAAVIKKFGKIIKRHPRRSVAVALAVVLVAGAVVFAIVKDPPATTTAQAVTHSTDEPDEKPIDKNTYKWQGGPEDPKLVKISKISVDAFIERMGVDQNKQIAVPTNIHLAGWYVDSAQPGQKGLAIIGGHVNGRVSADGVFKDLSKLAIGDQFEIERGDGTVYKYEVIKTTSVDTKKAASVLFSQEPKVAKQVNLITCVGTFDKAANQYTQRLIVAGKQLE